jgi:hypothetical protein
MTGELAKFYDTKRESMRCEIKSGCIEEYVVCIRVEIRRL